MTSTFKSFAILELPLTYTVCSLSRIRTCPSNTGYIFSSVKYRLSIPTTSLQFVLAAGIVSYIKTIGQLTRSENRQLSTKSLNCAISQFVQVYFLRLVHMWTYLPVQDQRMSRVSSCLDSNPGRNVGSQEKRCRNVARKRLPTHLRANRVLTNYHFSCRHIKLIFLPGYKSVKTLVIMYKRQGPFPYCSWSQEHYLNSCRGQELPLLDILAIHLRHLHRNKYSGGNLLQPQSCGRLLRNGKLVIPSM